MSVIFILITLFIDALGFGLVIPILPRLVQQLVGGAISDASFAVGLVAWNGKLEGHAVAELAGRSSAP